KQGGVGCCNNTKGWFLGKARARRVVEMGLDEMSISVDGPNETHDFIRRREGSFKHILDSLANLQEAREELGRSNPSVGITCTISALNQQNFSEVLDWLKDYKVISSLEFEYMFYTERWAEKATEKLIPLPAAPKEEDQVLPFYLRNVDVDVFYDQVQQTLAKGKDYKLNVAFQPPITTKEGISMRFFHVAHANAETCFY